MPFSILPDPKVQSTGNHVHPSLTCGKEWRGCEKGEEEVERGRGGSGEGDGEVKRKERRSREREGEGMGRERRRGRREENGVYILIYLNIQSCKQDEGKEEKKEGKEERKEEKEENGGKGRLLTTFHVCELESSGSN